MFSMNYTTVVVADVRAYVANSATKLPNYQNWTRIMYVFFKINEEKGENGPHS